MAIPFFFIAAILFAAAYQNRIGYLASNVEQDVKGFLPWAAAMAAIGAIGLIPKGRSVSNALFFLVILVMLIANKGILANIASGSAFKPVSPGKAPAARGATSAPPEAPPGSTKSGTLDTGTAAGNAASNIVPFPNFKFGPLDLGSIVPAGNATSAATGTSVENAPIEGVGNAPGLRIIISKVPTDPNAK